MRNMGNYFPSKYIKAEDLKGQTTKVIISEINDAEFDDSNNPGRKRLVPELSFQGKTKTLLLNKTNNNALIKDLGEDGDQWIGKTIELTPSRTTNQRGEVVGTILVGVPVGPTTQAPPPIQDSPPYDPNDDDIPF